MAISDAQFTEWIKSDATKVVLWEQKYAIESGGVAAESTVYLATRTYNTGSSDTPANQCYRGRIRSAPPTSRSINPDALGGRTEISVGGVTLDNFDKDLDFFPKLIIDGREGTWLIGAPEGTPGWARSDFRTMLVTLAEVVDDYDDKQIAVKLRDARLLLDKAIAGDVVTTSTDKLRKPLVFTFDALARQVELVQKAAATLEYFVLQNYVGASADRIHDRGVSLTDGLGQIFEASNAFLTADAGTDTLMFTAHPFIENDVVNVASTGGIFAGLTLDTEYWVIAAGLTANNFRLSATKGGAAVNITGTVFAGLATLRRQRATLRQIPAIGITQLSSIPNGPLTADVIGFSPSQSTSSTSGGPGELLRALLIDYGGVPTAKINASSFQTVGDSYAGDSSTSYLNTLQSTARAVIDRENFLDVAEDVARVLQIFYGEDHLGVFRAFRLNLSALAADAYTRELGINDLFGMPNFGNQRVIVGRAAVHTNKNVRPLSPAEIAAAEIALGNGPTLSADYREASENSPSGATYAANWQGYHKTAARVDVSGAFAQTNTDIPTIRDEIVGDLAPHIKIVRVRTDLRAYSWLLGDVVLFTYPRYEFTAGKNCKVIGIAPDFVAERCEVTMITRTTPDYTTASYN